MLREAPSHGGMCQLPCRDSHRILRVGDGIVLFVTQYLKRLLTIYNLRECASYFRHYNVARRIFVAGVNHFSALP